jgi:hypothetical protein
MRERFHCYRAKSGGGASAVHLRGYEIDVITQPLSLERIYKAKDLKRGRTAGDGLGNKAREIALRYS